MSNLDAGVTFAEMLENAAKEYERKDIIQSRRYAWLARVARLWDCNCAEDLTEALLLEEANRPTAVIPSVN